MKRRSFIYLVLLSLLPLVFGAFIAGCVSAAGTAPTLSPDQATGTAVVSLKYTEAAALTTTPATPQPVETRVYPTIEFTPNPGDITAADSGKIFIIGITSRISLILKEADYPRANLQEICIPENTLGGISNLPAVPPDYYAVRYEGVVPGVCTVSNGSFSVTINVKK